MLMGGRFAVLKFFAVLLAVGLLAFAAVACNGGGNGDETPQADETPEAGETPEADGGDDGDGDGDGDGGVLEDLAALAGESAGGITAKVTYRVATETDGETFEGEWVLVQRPPDTRFEFSGTEEGEDFRTVIINAGGNSYLCISAGGEESCLATGAADTEAQTAPLDALFDVPRGLADDIADVGLISSSRRSIAGLDATCFTVSSTLVSLGEGEICFSDGGLLLYMQSEVDGSSSTFEATSASTDVTDADFEPPFDVIDLGDLGG
jgi:hypothetical protein